MEASLRNQPGYRRLSRKQRKLRRIPTVDYVFRRRVAGKAEVVMMRFLLYRRWSYTLTLTTPARRWRRLQRANKRMVNSFMRRRR